MKPLIRVASVVLVLAIMLGSEATAAGPTTRVTGGGWIPSVTLTDKATFHFNATVAADGSVSGSVTYDDHGVGYSFRSTSIANVIVLGCMVLIFGNGQANGRNGEFAIVASDGGKTTRTDTFTFVSDPYENSSTVDGGNIHIPGCG